MFSFNPIMRRWKVIRRSPWAWVRVFLAVATLGLMAFVLIPSHQLALVDERLSDTLWSWSAAETREQRLVLVDIDEASLAALGAWPWPRTHLAQMADALARLGVRLQVFDLLLDQPRPGDDTLDAAVQGHPVVLGQYLVIDPAVADPPQTGYLYGALKAPGCEPVFPTARGRLGLTTGIRPVSAGHITPSVDRDGMIRRLPAAICHEGTAYPALSLAAYLGGLGATPELHLEAGRGLLAPTWWLTHPGQPGLRIPLDASGQWRIPYRQQRAAFVSISAHAVLTGAVPEGLLDGAWVLVGSTALGLGDRIITPLAKVSSGMEIHAQLITGLLDGRLPYSPRGRPWLLLGLALVLDALFLAMVGQRNRAMVMPIALAVSIVALVALQGWLLVAKDIWLGPMPVIVQLSLFVALLFAVDFARTLRERERLLANLRSYLPAGLAEDLARTLPTDRILGERTDACVWVADIRNFAAWGEARPPEEAVALLHGFYRLAERVIRAEGGTIENYIGDTVQALWLPGSDRPYPATAALRAAKALLREASPLLDRPPREGLSPLALGIGIECGTTLIGSIGPAARRSHTVLGETVSVAIRLQAMTEELAQPILVGPGARSQLLDQGLVPLGSFLLEGMRRPRDIYGCLPEPAAMSKRRVRVRA